MPDHESEGRLGTVDTPASMPQPETIGETGLYLSGPSTQSGDCAPPQDWPTIPGYVITGVLARGGMGCVHSGRDLALDREVAIKTLLPGADGERFVSEAQITAKLPHPGIPPVHALGKLGDGAPYLVMKLIRGQTLAAVLQSRGRERPDLSRLVQIFEQIGQAVGFAHAQGIIHRDLKPLNVMVGSFGEVQVMDWGLAKDTRSEVARRGGRETDSTPPGPDAAQRHYLTTQPPLELTAAGAILGTPGYMAPEQARGEEVDARADVFALGAILATILTGKPAFVGATAKETIQKAAAEELSDVLARLDACDADGELVALAKKCLAADARERPADARLVADEVAGYRARVEARLRRAETEHAGALVREGEQRKRRRVIRAAASLVTLVLVAGLALSLWQMKRAIGAEHDAEARRVQAETNLTFAKKGNEILGSVFAGLDPKAKYETVAELRNALRDNLEKAMRELEGSGIGEPLEVAAMQETLGMSLLSLGEAKSACEVLRRVLDTRRDKLGVDHVLTLNAMGNLAGALNESGDLKAALPLYEETLRLEKEHLGADHVNVLVSLNNLAAAYRHAGQFDRALALFEDTLQLMRKRHGPNNIATLSVMNNLAMTYHEAGLLDRALPLFEEAIDRMRAKHGLRHPDALKCLSNLAGAYREAGRPDRALPLHEEALALTRETLGPDHPDFFGAMAGMAETYRVLGRTEQASAMFDETLKFFTAKLGPYHHKTLLSMNNLALTHQQAGRLDLALPLFEETLRLSKLHLPPGHPETIESLSNLATCHREAGHFEKAIALHEEVLELKKKKLGPDHPKTLLTMNNLAATYWSMKRLDRSIPLFERSLELSAAKLGREHPDTQRTVGNLGVNYADAGRHAEAIQLLEEAHQSSKTHPSLRWIRAQLIGVYQKASRFSDAAVLLDEWLAEVRQQFPKDSPQLAGELARLGLLRLTNRQFRDAENLLRDALAVRETHTPDEWRTFATRSMLGAALTGQGRHAEAEPLLLAGYLGIRERADKIPAAARDQWLREAANWLVEHYTAAEKPEEAAKWQSARDQYGSRPP